MVHRFSTTALVFMVLVASTFISTAATASAPDSNPAPAAAASKKNLAAATPSAAPAKSRAIPPATTPTPSPAAPPKASASAHPPSRATTSPVRAPGSSASAPSPADSPSPNNRPLISPPPANLGPSDAAHVPAPLGDNIPTAGAAASAMKIPATTALVAMAVAASVFL